VESIRLDDEISWQIFTKKSTCCQPFRAPNYFRFRNKLFGMKCWQLAKRQLAKGQLSESPTLRLLKKTSARCQLIRPDRIFLTDGKVHLDSPTSARTQGRVLTSVSLIVLSKRL
jgi:hypothetical protein